MKMHRPNWFLMASMLLLCMATGRAEPPDPFDPTGLAEGSLPGVYPQSVTAANINITPTPGSVLGGSNSDNLRVTFPAAGPIRWTESRHNEGDVATLIGPFDPNDPSYFPPNSFVDNYKPLQDGQPFANTTLAWRVNRNSGALLATVRHNGVNQSDTFNGTPVGIKNGVAYFNADLGQGWGFRMNDGLFNNGDADSADLQMGVAGSDGDQGEASFNVATAFFPYEQGWLGAWVRWPEFEGEATFSHGHPDLDPGSVVWYPLDGEDIVNGALARVELPNVNSATDGMLFVAPTNGNNSTNIAAGSPSEGGWNVAVREDNDADVTGETIPELAQLGFQLLYIPYDAGGLVGGHVDGSDGSLLHGAGDSRFSLTRRAAGEYALSVLGADGQTKMTEDNGMLVLSVAGTVDGNPAIPGRAFLSYEYEPASSAFIIQSRELVDTNKPGQSANMFGDVLALRDTDFYFAFVDFQNPLRPEPGPTVPGDFDGDSLLTAADIDLLSAEVRSPTPDTSFDLNQDATVNQDDRDVWVNQLRRTYYGDANLDSEFSSADFVDVFVAGEYEDTLPANSGWATGDWNGDTEFDSSDFVTAFVAGGYELGPRAATAVVPEPSSLLLTCLAFALLLGRRSS